MKKLIFFLLVISFSIALTKAQSPPFAVVRPNGTTYICPTFDSAYTKAVDDDFIYMPGVTITGSKTITKRLTLIGAGHYLDSTIYTGKTIFTAILYLEKKSTLEGFECGAIYISNANADSCSFIRIKTNSLTLSTTNNHFIDGSIIENIYGNTVNCNWTSNILIKNSFLGQLSKIQNSAFKNCIFLGYPVNPMYVETSNCLYINCIFTLNVYMVQNNCYTPVVNTVNNSIYTAFLYYPPIGQNNIQNNQIDTIFINVPIGSPFNYSFNYHLKPNSPYLTAADDGGQIGIYGGAGPYKEGAVPGNPHIYFKQVASQTNNSGQLQIQFKVRTNN